MSVPPPRLLYPCSSSTSLSFSLFLLLSSSTSLPSTPSFLPFYRRLIPLFSISSNCTAMPFLCTLLPPSIINLLPFPPPHLCLCFTVSPLPSILYPSLYSLSSNSRISYSPSLPCKKTPFISRTPSLPLSVSLFLSSSFFVSSFLLLLLLLFVAPPPPPLLFA